jgi:hypothetical protein
MVVFIARQPRFSASAEPSNRGQCATLNEVTNRLMSHAHFNISLPAAVVFQTRSRPDPDKWQRARSLSKSATAHKWLEMQDMQSPTRSYNVLSAFGLHVKCSATSSQVANEPRSFVVALALNATPGLFR